MPASDPVSDRLAQACPALAREVHGVVENWVGALRGRLDHGPLPELRSKHLNDPIWGTIELHAWEVALLDTPLMQRLRGVRQLGLAQYVFPGGAHDRLEHVCGVIGAVEAMIQALKRQIERFNRAYPESLLPEIRPEEHNSLRLAALLHDIGHGPFSHAIEPLMAHSDVADAQSWRAEIAIAQHELKQIYELNKPPSVSETLAVMVVAATPMQAVIGHPNLSFPRPPVVELQNQIMAAIVGAVDGPGASHLTRIISSQIDGDKLDYLARDAHHTGLEIGFDTDRLLAKLEVLRIAPNLLDPAAEDLRQRAERAPNKHYFDIGIAASGFGSFEQMLIGRTFLYDRLYHHHKVRAADAMAQRLAHVAESERGRKFSLSELFLAVSDDTMIRILGAEVRHDAVEGGRLGAGRLARAILGRELYHRAYAFRGRFVVCPEQMNEDQKGELRRAKWTGVSRSLESLEDRLAIEEEIYDLTVDIGNALSAAGVTAAGCVEAMAALQSSGPESIIVDLPEKRADAIRILARYPDGGVRIPEFSFNPVKWADAYELQKRTGYVFCPREMIPLVALAARLVFLKRFGVVMSRDANAYIKVPSDVPEPWREALRMAGLLDEVAFDHLEQRRYSLLQIRGQDIPAPPTWLEEDPDFAVRVALGLNRCIPAGLVDADITALKRTLDCFFKFLDSWHLGSNITSNVNDEDDLQDRIRTFMTGQSLAVAEGQRVSGGKTDLVVEGRIVVENKFTGVQSDPANWAGAAATQGRRYAVGLGMRIVVIPLAYIPEPGRVPSKPQSVSVRQISIADDRRAEIRILIPYNASYPSRESEPRRGE